MSLLGNIGQAAGAAALSSILSAIAPAAGPAAGVSPPPPAGQPPSPDGMLFGLPMTTVLLIGGAIVGAIILLK